MANLRRALKAQQLLLPRRKGYRYPTNLIEELIQRNTKVMITRIKAFKVSAVLNKGQRFNEEHHVTTSTLVVPPTAKDIMTYL